MINNNYKINYTNVILRMLLYFFLSVFVLYYLLPLFVMVTTSLKSLEEIRTGSLVALPRNITFEAWGTAWSSACTGIQCEGLKPYFWNSILIAIPAVFISTLLGALNGYVVAQWRFKGANIIFKDADPEAIERGALRCFRNSGQSCNAPTRMLVEKSMYNEAVERVKKFANSMKVGDPKKEGEHIGPVVSETQYEKIQLLIQKGIDEGAKLIAGGVGKPDGIDKGYFVKPTAFADVNNQMEIARTEIFGPVLSIIPFENEEEAISIANDTDYGLTNYIQTNDKEKANRVARRLRSGMVDVNGAGIAVDAPFGGFKHSGIGREAGKEGLLEFLEVKSVGGWAN